MLVLSCLVLALSALALPAGDILGLFGDGDGDTPTPAHTRAVLHTPKPSPSLATPPASAEQPTPTPTTRTDPAEPTTTAGTAVASTPSVLPASAESHATDHASRTWQIVGIAIIAVLFIATSITCAMFFDRLWRFIKDAVYCTSRSLVEEEFIPDCEKPESLHEGVSAYSIRARELPWNSDIQDWDALHRQPSRRNDAT
ncbi:hypothetical protein HD554DRAFT_2085413 [Boletus coccyginus]|nr:hypothetical protein HD554DRAFT_2085413 [Boletus coccyginus]